MSGTHAGHGAGMQAVDVSRFARGGVTRARPPLIAPGGQQRSPLPGAPRTVSLGEGTMDTTAERCKEPEIMALNGAAPRRGGRQ
ncbi:MAG: hypothetical protein OXH69_00185 [Acidobacteria bacterium]|nr:hypothetical protein [Acidobacteriota bacterium]